jgi:2-polyprenyl-3-methyl-5-hydroxy-6-metoxy-1,4-benzoquinol methylase
MNPTTTAAAGRPTFIQLQFEHLQNNSQDVYANTKYAILKRYLGSTPQRILNVGCGSGDMSLDLAADGHTVLGIDIEPAHVELSNANLRRRGGMPNCSFMLSSIEDFKAEGEFDCVIATDVLEHIADDRGALARMVAALKPGGTVLLSVPAGRWLYGYHDEQLGHFRRYSRRSLRALVEEFCTVQRMRSFGFTLVPVCYIYSRLLRKPYPVAESCDHTKRPFRALALRSLMWLDRWVRPGIGISLLLQGVKKQRREEV